MKQFVQLFCITLLGCISAFSGDAAAPHRIVSLSPSTTEILYGIGAFSQVVAVSQYCTYPRQVEKMPRVGGPETGNIESVVAVHPDLVVLTTMQEPFIAKDLDDFGLKYLVVPSESLSDIFESIRSIGEATHHRAQATHLSDQMRNSLESIRAQTKDLPRPTVLLSVSRMPGSLSQLYVATAGSFLIDLIDIAGGRSIAAPSKIGYSNMSKEAILRLNPQIIVDVRHKSDSSLAEEGLSAWEELPELRALREKHIYAVNAPFVAHPSQFVTDTARLFVHLLHPDLRATNPGHD